MCISQACTIGLFSGSGRNLPEPQAPVWFQRATNPVLRGLTPLRCLEKGNPKIGFLVEVRSPMDLAKTFLEKIENYKR